MLGKLRVVFRCLRSDADFFIIIKFIKYLGYDSQFYSRRDFDYYRHFSYFEIGI
jgi:hypothetical protein